MILETIVMAVSSIIVLCITVKLWGNKEIKHLTLYDYVIGITFCLIAAKMATGPLDHFAVMLSIIAIYWIAILIIRKCT
ncbi:MAG: hypothetical protein ACLROI_12950 [Beduini sp.]|uniref:hypothetical protein n=1 Tax=Beduini sp. TaxID=1922300 RepID=UPI0011CA1576